MLIVLSELAYLNDILGWLSGCVRRIEETQVKIKNTKMQIFGIHHRRGEPEYR